MAAPQQRPQQQQRWTGACAPAPRRDDMVPWSAVEEALAMARVALDAKQRVAEVGPLGTPWHGSHSGADAAGARTP